MMNKVVLTAAMAVTISALTACSKPNDNQATHNNAQTSPAVVEQNKIDSTLAHGDRAETLDWAGTYKGILPCHDCSGIETEVELKLDHDYVLKQKFLGKANNNYVNEVKGKFQFVEGNDQLIQLDQSGDSAIYFVGEQFIELRDDKGQALNQPEFNFKLTKSLE